MARPAASPELRDRQRASLRRAAAEVYAENGLNGVSVRAIAQRADVSTGTLYKYFENLGDLMRSLWTVPVERANRDLEAIALEHPEPLERIRALLEKYLDFARANPEVYRGAFMLVRPPTLSRPDAQPPDSLPFLRLVREALHEGQLRGDVVVGDVEEMSQLLWAGLHGAIGLPINMDLYAVHTSERLATAMIRSLMRSIEA